MTAMAAEGQVRYLSTGDNICLYCSDTKGYVFSDRTCSEQNQLYIYNAQDKEKPDNVPNPQALAFQIHIQNRYKLGKKYRKLLNHQSTHSRIEGDQNILLEAKQSAEAETQDNVIEQKRLHGKALRYGAVIQLRHVFTEKYIHVDNTRTSSTDKSRLLLHLQAYDGKSAQFRLLPRYKVNSEGEEVRAGDQVIFESVKSPGHFFHHSPAFNFGTRGLCSELNLGVDPSEFTVIHRYSPATHGELSLWEGRITAGLQGGAIVQILHRHLEGYLSAQGVFVTGVRENVHLRIREADLLCPRTLYPPSSCSTLWQVEDERSILLGDNLRWEQRVRLRHLPTRMYLTVDPTAPEPVFLTAHASDPRTVFRLHAKNSEQGQIKDMSCARIEHVLSGTWLHGSKDNEYVRTTETWIKGTFKKVTVCPDVQYMDAFHIRLCQMAHVTDYNFLSGMMPLLSDMSTMESSEFRNSDDRFQYLMRALKEIWNFINEEVSERQNRRKLVREMQVLDLLVALLQSASSWPTRGQEKAIFEAIYDIFYLCIVGGTEDDSLYLAQYLDFFLAQIKNKEGFGFYVTRMLVELIRDRREVVERITPTQINSFTSLLKKYKHHRYIQLLSALCVVDGLALPSNQSRICARLIEKNKGCLLEMRIDNGVVLISKRGSGMEMSLQSFMEGSRSSEFRDDAAFLEKQLILFQRLCHGRNQQCIDIICKHSETMTWDVIMNVMKSPDVTDDVKAQFVNLLIVLFIDVGENTSYSQIMTNAFVYGHVGRDMTPDAWISTRFKYVEPHTEREVPALAEWITTFLADNVSMVASQRARNKLILSVLRVVRALLTFGYIGIAQLQPWMTSILPLMDGTNDLPSITARRKSAIKGHQNSCSVHKYRAHGRFMRCKDTRILVDAKYEALEILDVMQSMLFHFQVQKLVAVYKDVEYKWLDPKTRQREALCSLLHESFTPTKSRWRIWDPLAELSKALDKIFSYTETGSEGMLNSLIDLAHYDYPEIRAKALMLLQRHFTERTDVISAAKEAKLMQTKESLTLFKTSHTFMPLLNRLLAVKLYDDEMNLVSAILDKFKDCCKTAHDESKSNYIGQQLLVAYGIIPLLLSILERESTSTELKASAAQKLLVSNTLHLLELMARDNAEVQHLLMAALGTLLNVHLAPVQLAETLKEVFHRNAAGAWKIKSEHVKAIVNFVSTYRDTVPAFVEALTRLIVVNEEGSLIRRSQTLVMKHFLEAYPHDAYVFELPASTRRKILLLQEGQGILKYYIHLLNLLIYCGPGAGGRILSFCQNVFPLEELVTLLTNPDICTNLKRPLLRYLTCIYLQAASGPGDRRVHAMITGPDIWQFLQQLSSDIDFCLTELNKAGLQSASVPKTMSSCHVPDPNASMDVMQCKLFYIIDAVFDFFLEFLRLCILDHDQHAEEISILTKIAGSLLVLCPMMTASLTQANHYRTMRGAMQRLLHVAGYHQTDVDTSIDILEEARRKSPQFKLLKKMPSILDVGALKEIRLNTMMRRFMENAEHVLLKPNTIAGQLNLRGAKMKHRAYATGTTGSDLPLEVGFQEHVCKFLTKNNNINVHFSKTDIILRQLRASSERAKDQLPANPAIDAVDVRCLQILRATLHNLIVTLPDNWSLKTGARITRRLRMIRSLQEYYVHKGLVEIAFSLLSKQSTQVLTEVLALLCCLLFNANTSVQDASLSYFESTKEEVFFMVLNDQFLRSAFIIKERRAFQAMRRKQDSLLNTIEKENKPDTDSIYTHLDAGSDLAVEGVDAGPEGLFQFREDGAIMLMLAVLATLCDGQHRGMQDYLRHQPDNLRPFNIVAEATQFLSMLTSNITDKNIELVTQLLTTLNEICQGNQKNREVTLDHKVIDFINSIIRTTIYDNCSNKQILTLYRAIADLLISLLEESSPEALRVAKEVAATVDVKAILRILGQCHNVHRVKSWSFGARFRFRKSNKVGSIDSSEVMSKYENEKVRNTALKYYIVVSRIREVAPDGGQRISEAEVAYTKYVATYKSSVASIEIIKDDHLQKVYFPVPLKSQIRQEVKERLQWNIDRTSPTNKIRDFMRWSSVIINEILYSRKVLSNPISMFVSSQWMLWNYCIIFLSVVINVIMLVTWEAKASLKNVRPNATALPAAIDDPVPLYPLLPDYKLVLLILGITHNAFSVLLLLSYFLIQNPKLPRFDGIKNVIRKFRAKGTGSEAEDQYKSQMHSKVRSEMDESIFTVKSLFIIFLVGSSFAGTMTHGYFFAVHLLNIVNTNQLLKGVIKAVTQNGRSLIWVAILGLIMLYVYALLGFAFFRASFEPGQQLYCNTLYECSVTIIRYGMIGDIDERLAIHPLKNTFTNFGFMVIYQVTFFIFFTTIGLNIIFGIIVDTFSELRDLKWRAEKDMQETCFICSRQSYDFEHFSKGFRYHVRKEHNMWTYIHYFLYLSDTNPNEYTALDAYVADRLKRDQYAFFPLNRALCLASLDDEAAESKLDTVAEDVSFLVRQHHDGEASRLIQLEREENRKWRKERLREAAKILLRQSESEHAEPPPELAGQAPASAALPPALAGPDTASAATPPEHSEPDTNGSGNGMTT